MNSLLNESHQTTQPTTQPFIMEEPGEKATSIRDKEVPYHSIGPFTCCSGRKLHSTLIDEDVIASGASDRTGTMAIVSLVTTTFGAEHCIYIL